MAIHDPCALLTRLLREARECEWIEYKLNNDDPDRIGQYVSALSNSAMLAERDKAFLVFGIDDHTRNPVGTSVRLEEKKVGGEDFSNWLNRSIDPQLLIEIKDFICDEKHYSVIAIEPSYERPTKFKGSEYIRIGQNNRKLSDLPEHERALWLATGRRKFENAIAKQNLTAEEIFELLDPNPIYELVREPIPRNNSDIIRKLVMMKLINDNFEGRFDITNLGAILLARDVSSFPSIRGKAVRIIKYLGLNKSNAEFEQEGRMGYALGFSGMIKFLMGRIGREEKYKGGIRRMVPVYPEEAIRETIANALIHQDFTITGVGPIVEIYDNRIEITNPGGSLISTDRIIDERRSRNELLALTMRSLGLCEERGGGLDKTVIEIEKRALPAPEFISSVDSMRVILFGPKKFGDMSKKDKMRACYYHCVIRWLQNDFMSNSTLRERFSLEQDEYQAVSAIISESVREKRIAPADPDQGKRNAKYIPYWAS